MTAVFSVSVLESNSYHIWIRSILIIEVNNASMLLLACVDGLVPSLLEMHRVP